MNSEMAKARGLLGRGRDADGPAGGVWEEEAGMVVGMVKRWSTWTLGTQC